MDRNIFAVLSFLPSLLRYPKVFTKNSCCARQIYLMNAIGRNTFAPRDHTFWDYYVLCQLKHCIIKKKFPF